MNNDRRRALLITALGFVLLERSQVAKEKYWLAHERITVHPVTRRCRIQSRECNPTTRELNRRLVIALAWLAALGGCGSRRST